MVESYGGVSISDSDNKLIPMRDEGKMIEQINTDGLKDLIIVNMIMKRGFKEEEEGEKKGRREEEKRGEEREK